MPKNINISSGSKSFQNKIFGSIVKLSKPSFVYEGKIFSDSTFNNQRTTPVPEDNIYYVNHGLPDEPIIYDYEHPIDLTILIQSLSNKNTSLYSILSTIVNNTSVASRNNISTVNSSVTVPLLIDPTDPNYPCQVLGLDPP